MYRTYMLWTFSIEKKKPIHMPGDKHFEFLAWSITEDKVNGFIKTKRRISEIGVAKLFTCAGAKYFAPLAVTLQEYLSDLKKGKGYKQKGVVPDHELNRKRYKGATKEEEDEEKEEISLDSQISQFTVDWKDEEDKPDQGPLPAVGKATPLQTAILLAQQGRVRDIYAYILEKHWEMLCKISDTCMSELHTSKIALYEREKESNERASKKRKLSHP